MRYLCKKNYLIFLIITLILLLALNAKRHYVFYKNDNVIAMIDMSTLSKQDYLDLAWVKIRCSHKVKNIENNYNQCIRKRDMSKEYSECLKLEARKYNTSTNAILDGLLNDIEVTETCEQKVNLICKTPKYTCSDLNQNYFIILNPKNKSIFSFTQKSIEEDDLDLESYKKKYSLSPDFIEFKGKMQFFIVAKKIVNILVYINIFTLLGLAGFIAFEKSYLRK